jgi:hypothetical protein
LLAEEEVSRFEWFFTNRCWKTYTARNTGGPSPPWRLFPGQSDFARAESAVIPATGRLAGDDLGGLDTSVQTAAGEALKTGRTGLAKLAGPGGSEVQF